LALVHVLLSPDIYGQQYLMSGMFRWLMVWRVLNRCGLGTDPKVLAVLAVAISLFMALLEASWIWIYQGFGLEGTLANNFNLDVGISAAWQCLAAGLLIAVRAAIRQATRPHTGSGDQITSA
jgi:methionine sulfoxide reductase heme-binding subunit